MKILNKKIHITTNNKTQMINITGEIQQIIDNENINEGLINIQTKHTTTAIIINEDEEGLKEALSKTFWVFSNFIMSIPIILF